MLCSYGIWKNKFKVIIKVINPEQLSEWLIIFDYFMKIGLKNIKILRINRQYQACLQCHRYYPYILFFYFHIKEFLGNIMEELILLIHDSSENFRKGIFYKSYLFIQYSPSFFEFLMQYRQNPQMINVLGRFEISSWI